jgi:predicted ester cyclase
MSTEPNKILVRRYIEERWNERKLWLTDELVSPVFVLHTPSGDLDLSAFNEAIVAYLRSFPDSHVSIEDVVAEGDRVAIRYSFRGTHRGEFMGVAMTGNHTLCVGMAFYRVAGGRLAEGWFIEDTLGLLEQLKQK